jgi:hypothetical protein
MSCHVMLCMYDSCVDYNTNVLGHIHACVHVHRNTNVRKTMDRQRRATGTEDRGSTVLLVRNWVMETVPTHKQMKHCRMYRCRADCATAEVQDTDFHDNTFIFFSNVRKHVEQQKTFNLM